MTTAGYNFLKAEFWFSVGARRKPTGVLKTILTAYAALISIWVIISAVAVILDPWTLTSVFLAMMFALAFLMVGPTPYSHVIKPNSVDWIFSVASLVTGAYFLLNAGGFTERISLLFPLQGWEIVFGWILFLLSLEITRRTTGLGLTTMVLLFILYNFFGHTLDGVLQHSEINYNHFLDIMVYTTDGILGLPVHVAATYAFLFVLFGTVLQQAKGSEFFFDLAAAISGRSPGGPAKVAVVSSAMYGMISGSPTSDVVTTGAITIPIMKRLNYPGALAGAIEVTASTGGSIMPPIMGSAAFIMAEYTGIKYSEIVIAAILPAILYYVCVFSQVHFKSLRMPELKILDQDKIPPLLDTLKRGWVFLVPLIVLTTALLYGYTPTRVAVFGTVVVVIVAFFRKDTRISLWGLFQALSDTAVRMIPVAGACAAAGVGVGGITMTGLSAKFGHVIYNITDAQLFPTLLLSALLTIVMGLGMPTPSAYILAAVLVGPILLDLQIPALAAHMFLLYYAVMSAITPPVAVAAYAASSIAEANPLKIAVISVRLALAAFIVPFVFVYGPELLLIGSPLETALTFISAAVGLVLLSASIEAYDRLSNSWWTRLLLAIGALFLIFPSLNSLIIGMSLAGFSYFITRFSSKHALSD
ncbi:MAG: TRAP transporter permease [Gammaproteobacteria bacterium]